MSRKNSLPHRMPSVLDDHPTPLLPPEARPAECPECGASGACNECGGAKTISIRTEDGSIEQSCDGCRGTGVCDCCGGERTVTPARWQAWFHEIE